MLVAIARRSTAEDAFDSRQQLAQVERLWQVVVRTHLEADDAVDDFAPPGQDDDPDTRFLTQQAGQCEAVFTGQHQIQNDEIDRGLRHHPTHLGAVLSGRNPVTLAGQVLLHEVADFTLIVDD